MSSENCRIYMCIWNVWYQISEIAGTKTLHNYFLVELGMKLMLWITFTIIFPAIPTGVYLAIDPRHVLMGGNIEENNKFGLILARNIIALLACFEVMKAVNAFFIVGLMVVSAMNDIIHDLSNRSNLDYNLIRRLNEINLYRKLFIWNKYTNQNFCSFSVPPLIFFWNFCRSASVLWHD